MLKIVTCLKDLPFSALMEVYLEGNQEKGNLLQAEQDFYQYLKEGFFSEPEDRYCLWEVEGRPVSALRLQAYRDGFLLEALETAPEERRKGYARALIQCVAAHFPQKKIYVHIGKRNKPSIAVHEACGFRRICDMATYADGSVTDRCYTYLR